MERGRRDKKGTIVRVRRRLTRSTTWRERIGRRTPITREIKRISWRQTKK